MATPKSGYAPNRRKSDFRKFDFELKPEQGPVKPEPFNREENNKGHKLRLPNGQVIRALAGASVPADRTRMFDRKKNK